MTTTVIESDDYRRELAERLAAEKYPEPSLSEGSQVIDVSLDELSNDRRNAYVSGYLAARTISTEELEAAAGSLAWRLNEWEDGQIVWESPEDIAEEIAACKPFARVALTAAGLLIEGGDDDHP